MIWVNIWAALILLIQPVFLPQQQAPAVTPDQIIQAVNAVRTSNGLPAMRVNATLMGTAQYAADLMASSQATSNLGAIKDRIIAAGYGSGSFNDAIFGTENFAISTGNTTAAQIVRNDWSDAAHMIPMTNPNYCDVGAGVSQAGDGSYYYVLHAAYNRDVPCGKIAAIGSTPGPTGTPTTSGPQYIVPIIRSTPDSQGRIFHVVRPGQSLWYIAISYGTKINAIMALNNMEGDNKTLYNGERLLIPTSLTPLPSATPFPSMTPTPVDTVTVQLPSVKFSGTEEPSPTPTVDPADQAAVDERFRGGLFIALVISIVLIVLGLFLNRR